MEESQDWPIIWEAWGREGFAEGYTLGLGTGFMWPPAHVDTAGIKETHHGLRQVVTKGGLPQGGQGRLRVSTPALSRSSSEPRIVLLIHPLEVSHLCTDLSLPRGVTRSNGLTCQGNRVEGTVAGFG